MNNWAITTSKARGKHNLGLTDYAQTLADQLQIPVIARENKGIAKLIHQYNLDVLMVEEDDGLVAHWQDGQVFTYHPGMAVPRIKHIKDGDSDMLIDVLGIEPGDKVLDCTMGMASDAVTISFALGAEGNITALESSPVIYAITDYGLKHWNWQQESKAMRQAMERITPICCKYETYLQELCKKDGLEYDVIYFDPMFERPVMESSGIAPLRKAADYAPLTQDILELASTLCRKRVVVKHRDGTLKQLQFDRIEGGKYSSLSYGILEAKVNGERSGAK